MFGYPSNMFSERVLSLISHEMITFCCIKDIQRFISSHYQQSSNGKVESVVKIMTSLYRRTSEDPSPSRKPCFHIITPLQVTNYLLHLLTYQIWTFMTNLRKLLRRDINTKGGTYKILQLSLNIHYISQFSYRIW